MLHQRKISFKADKPVNNFLQQANDTELASNLTVDASENSLKSHLLSHFVNYNDYNLTYKLQTAIPTNCPF